MKHLWIQFKNKIIDTPWRYGFALGIGLLQSVAFDFSFDNSAPWLAGVLSFISLVGFLWGVTQLTSCQAMVFGYLFGFGAFAWGLNWIYISMSTFGGAPLIFAIIANAAIVMYLSLYWLLMAYFIVRLSSSRNQRLLIAPAIITLFEWVRANFIIGFPWLSIGYGYVDSPIAQIAPLVGVFGVSFAVVFFAVLLLLETSRHYRILSLALVFLIVVFLSAWQSEKTALPSQLRIALIQGNMPVILQYNDERMQKNLHKYKMLTQNLLGGGSKVDLVVWPESAIPYFYAEAGQFLADMHALQQKYAFDLITGLPRADWRVNNYFNSILFQKSTLPFGKKPAQFYDKYNLLAFGEYLPLRPIFAFFERVVSIPMADFSRGKVEQAPFESGGLSFAPSICFEIVFGNDIRRNAQNAHVLVNLSNDAWFDRSKAQQQHLAIARMRAIENQKMLIRATNNGLTAVISPNGKVAHSIEPFTDGILRFEIRGYDIQTLYSRWGDCLIIVISLLWLIFVFSMGYIKNKRARLPY